MGKSKIFCKVWKSFLAVMLLTAALGISASAAGTKTVDMSLDSSGTYVYAGIEADYETTVYHRFTVPSSGLIAVTGNQYNTYSGSAYGIYVSLCNSSLTPLDKYSSGAYVNAASSDVEYYGVSAGTYYLKVSGEKKYAVGAAFQKVSDKAGASKAKARTIKQKKEVKGVLAAGEKAKKADWYKFKVTKSKKLKLELSTGGNGYIEFYLYGPSYKKGIRIDALKNTGGTYFSVNGVNRKKIKVKPGTYYIRVRRASYDTKASGIYSIKWQLK